MAVQVGRTVPRLWTRPLRELTPDTSLGFEVSDFAAEVLHVRLRPWQKWLLVHALELCPDGQYRFRRVVVLVARQNGKTLLASVLAAWWLFVDSARCPGRVPPVKFKIMGTAQNLDIAREPWGQVKIWCDPDPDTAEEAELGVPMLRAAAATVRDTNGDQKIVARSRAHYEVRAAKNVRGKPAARVLMDEIREQHGWEAWNAVSQTAKSFWSGQLWAISNAGSARSVVLLAQRQAGLDGIADWERCVDSGDMTVSEFCRGHDFSVGLFEWSAPDGCGKEDADGILQANPSIGCDGCAITVASCVTDARSMPDADYRTEVLCQWVTSDVQSYVDPTVWDGLVDPGSAIVAGGRVVAGVDVSADRGFSSVAVAGLREDGRFHVEVVARRTGMLWVVPLLERIRAVQGVDEVAVQGRGCAACEFADPLEAAGFTVRRVQGSGLGASTGRFRDRVLDGSIAHLGQPVLRAALEGGVTVPLNDQQVWSRRHSEADISPAVAVTYALYGFEMADTVRSAYEDGHGVLVV